MFNFLSNLGAMNGVWDTDKTRVGGQVVNKYVINPSAIRVSVQASPLQRFP